MMSIVYAAAMINYVIHHIDFGSWIIIGKTLQFQTDKIWILIPMFLFGLYAYKKEWLTRGDIGTWKIWGVLAFIPLALYVLFYHIGILSTLDEILKVVEHNMQFDNKIASPLMDGSVQLSGPVLPGFLNGCFTGFPGPGTVADINPRSHLPDPDHGCRR